MKRLPIIGWTGITDARAGEPAAGFIFDRMLGTNMDIDVARCKGGEDPMQRPFDLARIFEDMAQLQGGELFSWE